MGSELKKVIGLLVVLSLIILTSCTMNKSLSSEEKNSVSFHLSMNNAQDPNSILVRISMYNYVEEKESHFDNPGGLVFQNLPLGDAGIYIEAKTVNDIKILDGHTYTQLNSGYNAITMPLNNVMISRQLSGVQENEFWGNTTGESFFWSAIENASLALLKSNITSTRIVILSAYGMNGYYFLFDIYDDEFFAGGTQTNNYGEWINDALIFYLSPNMPTESPDFNDFNRRTFFKLQCMVGATVPNNGLINLVWYENGNEINNFSDQIHQFSPVQARIFQKSSNRRILELKINPDYFPRNISFSERGALAIRYIDNKSNIQPDMIDWKRAGNCDPVTDIFCWGNYELE